MKAFFVTPVDDTFEYAVLSGFSLERDTGELTLREVGGSHTWTKVADVAGTYKVLVEAVENDVPIVVTFDTTSAVVSLWNADSLK